MSEAAEQFAAFMARAMAKGRKAPKRRRVRTSEWSLGALLPKAATPVSKRKAQ